MPLFQGAGTALITPFHADLSVNYDKLAELIEFQIEQGIDALLPVGTTGESAALSDEEKNAIYKFCSERVQKRVPLIMGTGSNRTDHAVALTQSAIAAGADAVLAVTPYYNKGNDSGLIHYYKSVAEAAQGRPVMAYNVPARTGVNLSLSVLKEIAKISNINMFKEASGNISYAAECARECPSLTLYGGNDDSAIPLMSLGAQGVVSVASNLIPKQVSKMSHAFLKAQNIEACRMQLQANSLNNILFIETSPVPVKEALNLMGWDVGVCRPPLGQIAETSKQQLIKVLQEQGLLK